MARRVRTNARAKFAQASNMYHMVLEAELAQPASTSIEDYVERWHMPGFSEGLRERAAATRSANRLRVKTRTKLCAGQSESGRWGELLRGLARKTECSRAWFDAATRGPRGNLEVIYAFGSDRRDQAARRGNGDGELR